MFSMNRFRVFDFAYKKELYVLVTVVVAGLIGFSLYSYNAHDSSWFHYSSGAYRMQNACGRFGANLAAFLIYLLGSAAYILLPMLGFVVFWLWAHKEWREEWERLLALFGLLILGTVFFSMHGIDLFHTSVPGGYVGHSMINILYRFFDRIGSLLLVYAGIYASLVLLLRLSFIGLARSILGVAVSVYSFFVRHKIVQRGYAYVGMVFYAIGVLVRTIMQFFDDSETEQPNREDEHFIQRDHTPASSHNAFAPQVPYENTDMNTSVSSDYEEPQQEVHEQIAADTVQEHSSEVGVRSYGLPNLDIFIGVDGKKEDVEFKRELEERAHILEDKLERFGVYGSVISIKSGPVVTLFEYQPEIDTKLSRILSLEDDLALALQALSIRIIAPIPGRAVVGFEVSNKKRKEVLLASVIQSSEYLEFDGLLPLILGQDTVGNDMVVDLAKMPHLLIAGSTGSGKSVALNSMLISLLCKCTPDELRLILIDPKRLEFAPYADISHLLFPIVTDPKCSVPVLKWVVRQMDTRYEKMAHYGVRNVFEYNRIAVSRGEEKFPFIVIIIDELSDLMMTVGRDVEDLITRITQMARAAGIHMIIATQRPSVDVITGLIKVNFPSRISCRVTSKVDSRTILDCGGADKLLGRGDMLFLDSTASILKRVHGAYVSDEEIASVTSHIRDQRVVEYLDVTQELAVEDSDISIEDEELYTQVVNYLDSVEEISISSLQRALRIGYNRSARMISMLEMKGLIMPSDGGKARRVIKSVSKDEW